MPAVPDEEGAYRRARDSRPDLAETHYNLALWLQSRGRSEEAIAGYRAALARNPAFGRARNNLGNLLRAAGRREEAMEQYALAVRDEPALPEPYANWGGVLREAGRFDEAIALLERSVEIRPDSPRTLNDLGIALFARYRYEDALERHRRALELQPAFDDALSHMGEALAALGRWEEALRCFAEGVARRPASAAAHNNLGRTWQATGNDAAALESLERALELAPGDADALCSMGSLLVETGRGDAAMEHFRQALRAAPGLPRAAHALALEHLKRFEFARGWELAESRFDTVPPVTPRRALGQPVFSHADWGRGRLALWREQGVGDQLMFASLLPEVEARGQPFVAEVDRRLLPAFARAHPGWETVSLETSEAAFARCDRQLPLGSLPRLLRPTLESFAAQPRALLAADATRAESFRRTLDAGKRWIGVSWRSFQPARRGRLAAGKSAPLAAFRALADAAGVGLLDLQYGDTEAEREAFDREGGRLSRLPGLDLFEDLDGVMAAIEACEAVVTTSNLTAHLAGSIGKRTLLVYPGGAAPFHYWIAGPGGRSLWYPSVEIVTGDRLDSWEKVVARAVAALGA